MSGYTIVNLHDNQRPLPPQAELSWWYQYYFATDRGRDGYNAYRHDFNKLIWKIASPKWNFDDLTYDRTAVSFDNEDHVDIVIHNYRWRLELASGDQRYALLEHELQLYPKIAIPSITIGSDFDGAAADGAHYRAQLRARMRIARYRASAITFPKKLRKLLRKRFSIWSHCREPPSFL